jgi:Holliday junction resolvase RusA-like endonuclease
MKIINGDALKMARKVIRIEIQTEPVAKARARTVIVNGQCHSYTPERTRDAQDLIRLRVMRHQEQCFGEHIPVKLTIVFYRTKSKWLSKKETLPMRKPDLDNMGKLIQDSLNGVLYKDDAQITSLSFKKKWTDRSEGYITIRLEEDTL